MPPKRTMRTAPAAAAAVVADTGETPTGNATAADRAARRRAREEPAEEQRAVRARQEVAEVRSWRLDSRVRDILLDQLEPGIENMGLRDFVTKYVRRDYPIEQIDDYAMKIVVTNPNRFIPEELREDIEGLRPFQLLRDAYLLEQRGVATLRQWRDFGDKGIVSICSRGILDGVEVQNTEILQGGQVLAGLYESIYDAKWDYVVKSLNGVAARFWMEVKEGNFPPSLEWTDEEVDYLTHNVDTETADRIGIARQEELKEDEENVKPKQERLVMKVLTSPKGWSYGLHRSLFIFDCFVTKEVERAWRVVRNDISDCFVVDSGVFENPWQRVLIGTPGIGKSMGVGSYLLYQLLQYDAKILPVVAYFISKKTYIFNKITKHVTLYDDVMGLAMVQQLDNKYNGYTIYDCSKETGGPPVGLPDSWGTVVISTPDENNFKGWAKEKSANRLIINCPHERDIKAMCAWKKRDKPNELQKYWAKIEKCMSHVGPIPRFIFDDVNYGSRSKALDVILENVNPSTVEEYCRVGSYGLWPSESPLRMVLKIVRLTFDVGFENFYNDPICPEVREKLLEAVGTVIDASAIQTAFLFSLNKVTSAEFEDLSVGAFRNIKFIEWVRKNIKELPFPPERKSLESRRCVLEDDKFKGLTSTTLVLTYEESDGLSDRDCTTLYKPDFITFPVVDGFFFVEEPRKTIVGIQITKDDEHHTTTSKVNALRKRLSKTFEEWNDFSTDLAWEIIYVQYKDCEPMTGWQECINDFDQEKSNKKMSLEEHEAIAEYWKEKVHQYHLQILPEDIHDNI